LKEWRTYVNDKKKKEWQVLVPWSATRWGFGGKPGGSRRGHVIGEHARRSSVAHSHFDTYRRKGGWGPVILGGEMRQIGREVGHPVGEGRTETEGESV